MPIRRTIQSILIGAAGVFFVLSGYFFWQRNNPYRLSFSTFPTPPVVYSDHNVQPIRLRIPRLVIDLPVDPVLLEKNMWPASSTGISYLSSSAVPGEQGNSILYGHNWPNLLGPMKKIQSGDVIEVELSNGVKRIFIVSATEIVTPDQTRILSQTEDVRLTIYTCNGFLDRKRFVVTARLW